MPNKWDKYIIEEEEEDKWAKYEIESLKKKDSSQGSEEPPEVSRSTGSFDDFQKEQRQQMQEGLLGVSPEEQFKRQAKEQAFQDTFNDADYLGKSTSKLTDDEKKIFFSLEDEFEKRGGKSPSRQFYEYKQLTKQGLPAPIAAQQVGLNITPEGDVSIDDNQKDFYLEQFNDKFKKQLEKKKKSEKRSFYYDLNDRIFMGTSRLTTAWMDMLGTVDPTGKIKKLANDQQAATDYMQWKLEKTDSQNKDISELWKEGDKTGAVAETVLQLGENLPQLTMLAAGGIGGAPKASLLLMGETAGAQKYRELSKENVGEGLKILNSTLSGLSEMVFEGVGTMPILKTARKAVTELGEDQARRQLSQIYGSEFERVIKGLTKGVSAPLREGISEGATE